MTTEPLVSIIIPCYNYGQFLAEAIDSALNQTHKPVEVIVVNDGSSDSTAEVAKKYGDGIHYIQQENAGLSAARNSGIAVAKGEYIVCLDADDRLEPDFVEACLKELKEHPKASYVYTQMRLFGRQNSVTHYPNYSLKTLVYGNYINATVLIRAELVKKFKYDTSLKIGWEDYNLYLTLGENGYFGHLLNRPLLNYRKHSSMVDAVDLAKERELLGEMMQRHPKLYSASVRARIGLVYLVRQHSWLARPAKWLKRQLVGAK